MFHVLRNPLRDEYRIDRRDSRDGLVPKQQALLAASFQSVPFRLPTNEKHAYDPR